jgi:alcohol dehydrogenase class IV
MKQLEIEGWGSLSMIPETAAQSGASNLLLVTGKQSFTASGARAALEEYLRDYPVTRFSDFRVNCRIEDVGRGVQLLKSKAFDLVIAVGGGSVIDMAKLVNVFAANGGEIMSYVDHEATLERKGLPLVAVPTTSGSGSEATHFAVLYVDTVKHSISHEFMRPDYSIVDPSLTVSLPGAVTASSGIDALGQAIESYWSVNSTDLSKGYSEQAIELTVEHLVNAVKAPDNPSREAMSRAAHLAGKAIDIAKTTGPHALSYYFTSHYNVPHGHAVGLTLGNFIRFNSLVGIRDVADARGLRYVRDTVARLLNLLGVRSAEEGMMKIETMMKEIGLETDVKEIGLRTKADVQELVRCVNTERLANNPRTVSPQDIPALLGVG